MLDRPNIKDESPIYHGNRWVNQTMKPKTTIVCHTIGGFYDSLGHWFNNPSAVASTNFGIAEDGRASMYVDDSGPDSPYANGGIVSPDAEFLRVYARNGNRNPNFWTVSIEHEDKLVPYHQITDYPSQFEASTLISAWLCQKWGIDPLADGAFLGHYQIDGVNRRACPGWYAETWETYINEVKGLMTLDERLVRVEKLLASNGIKINGQWLFNEAALQYLANDGASAYQGLFEVANRVTALENR